MKDLYELIKLDNEPYDYLIIAKTYVNPLSVLDEIAGEIDGNNERFLFDLTLINGMNSNRYIKGDCVNGTFLRNSFMVVNDIDKKIKERTQTFFLENKNLVDNSVVPKSLKFLLKERMV